MPKATFFESAIYECAAPKGRVNYFLSKQTRQYFRKFYAQFYVPDFDMLDNKYVICNYDIYDGWNNYDNFHELPQVYL